MTSEELLQQQLATSRKKPKGVKVPVAVGLSYNVELQKLVREIRADINAKIVSVVKSTSSNYTRDAAWIDLLVGTIDAVKAKWSSPAFNAVAMRIASKFVREAATANEKNFKRDVGIDVFTGNQSLQDAAQLAISNNVALIKSIPAQYLTQVESIVLTNVRAGNRPSAITSLLVDQFGVTERRAKMIARDQTSKVNGDLTAKRQQESGFDYFEWDDSDDERVRKRHSDIAEKVTVYGKGVYSWSSPPLSDKGVPIIPGQDFQCRCIARPVSQREVDANVKAGRTNPSVKR